MSNIEERLSKIEKTITALLDDSKSLRENIAHGFKKIDENFEKINKRFEGIDKRLEGIDKRLDLTEGKLEVIEGKVDILQGNTSSNFKTVDGKLDNLSEEIGKINDVTSYDAMYKNMKIVNK